MDAITPAVNILSQQGVLGAVVILLLAVVAFMWRENRALQTKIDEIRREQIDAAESDTQKLYGVIADVTRGVDNCNRALETMTRTLEMTRR